jgi:glucosyl-dolichyl phosphate glucuronosyltransferase
MTISVIIATFNRSALLAECLQYIAQQQFEAGDEVIVVDNGSTDATAQVLAAASATMPVPLICVSEPVPGKTQALARAVKAASGNVLAFTDDDVHVEPGWLPAIRHAMTDTSVALMGGPVLARWEKRPPRWLRGAAEGLGRLSAPIALLNYGDQISVLEERTVLGANMAVRRDAFIRIGGFATHLGKLRGTLLSGEDHDLCQRIQAAGHRAIYHPDARVRHWVPTARMRVAYHLSWFYWSGITHATLDGDGAERRQIVGVPLFLVRRAVTGLFLAAGAAATGAFGPAVTHLCDVAFASGYAVHRWRAAPTPAAFRVSRSL